MHSGREIPASTGADLTGRKALGADMRLHSLADDVRSIPVFFIHEWGPR